MSKNKQNLPKPEKAQPKGSTPSANRREQLRLEREAEAKRQHTNKIIAAIGIALAVAIVAIVAVVAIQNLSKKNTNGTVPRTVGEQIVPSTANADQSALVVAKGKADDSKPLVTVYEDPQCPACSQAAKIIDPKLNALAEKGDIRLEYSVLHFLDRNFPGEHSERGAQAMACAADVNQFAAYSEVLYANQPKKEGEGYTDLQLRVDFPKQAGISGADLEKFQKCYDTTATQDFVKSMADKQPSYVEGTPTFIVNQTEMKMTQADYASEEALLAAIQRTAGTK